MAQRDYYDLLGVSPNASLGEIKTAYRKLAMKWHPDRNKAKNAEAVFKTINAAYECLKDKQRRAEYDRTRGSADPSEDEDASGWRTDAGSPASKPPTAPRSPAPPHRHPPNIFFALALISLLGSNWLIPQKTHIEAAAPIHQTETTVPSRPVGEPPPVMEDQPITQTRREEGPPAPSAEQLRRAERARRAEAREKIQSEKIRVEQERRRQEEARQEEARQEEVRLEQARQERHAQEMARQEEAERRRLAEIEEFIREDMREEKERRARRQADWDRESAAMFGAPLRSGSPCKTTLLKNFRCVNLVPEDFAGVSFVVIGDQDGIYDDRVLVRMTEGFWSLTVHRRAWVYPHYLETPVAIPDDLGHRLGVLTRIFLRRFGFSQEMMRRCAVQMLAVGTSAALEYQCQRRPPNEMSGAQFQFSVQLTDAAGNAGCRSHPLCPSSDKDRDQTSPPTLESPSKADDPQSPGHAVRQRTPPTGPRADSSCARTAEGQSGSRFETRCARASRNRPRKSDSGSRR
jgi:curved DNA-binding protein CbpA